eukprot:TRINITY_DN1194_c0_g1_i1.p3 TRINITY_DN1194_c0_g1~~TRINITY_DN1194_c0_g1_i1.p3  ORF type:complete len:77 (+),score=18.27 TRINITY_DN1194_c0_g1_i1:200-430(+)
MLDGARDTDGNVKLRSDDLASLTDLQVVGSIASVHSSTGSTNSTTELAASSSMILKFSALLRARPPETTTLAEVTE